MQVLYEVRVDTTHFNPNCWFSCIHEWEILRHTKKSWLAQATRNGKKQWISKSSNALMHKQHAQRTAWERNIILIASLESGIRHLRDVCAQQERGL